MRLLSITRFRKAWTGASSVRSTPTVWTCSATPTVRWSGCFSKRCVNNSPWPFTVMGVKHAVSPTSTTSLTGFIERDRWTWRWTVPPPWLQFQPWFSRRSQHSFAGGSRQSDGGFHGGGFRLGRRVSRRFKTPFARYRCSRTPAGMVLSDLASGRVGASLAGVSSRPVVLENTLCPALRRGGHVVATVLTQHVQAPARERGRGEPNRFDFENDQRGDRIR